MPPYRQTAAAPWHDSGSLLKKREKSVGGRWAYTGHITTKSVVWMPAFSSISRSSGNVAL